MKISISRSQDAGKPGFLMDKPASFRSAISLQLSNEESDLIKRYPQSKDMLVLEVPSVNGKVSAFRFSDVMREPLLLGQTDPNILATWEQTVVAAIGGVKRFLNEAPSFGGEQEIEVK